MILVSAMLFGTYGIWSVIIGDDFGVFYQGWVRSLLVMLLMIPFMIWKKQFRRIERRDLKWLALPCFFAIFTQAPLYYAYNVTSISTATLIFYASYTVASYFIGVTLMKEKLTVTKIIAILLAFIGLVMVFGASSLLFSLLGLGLAFLNGIASGIEVSSTKKVTQKYPSSLVLFYAWLTIFLTHLPASIILGESQLPPGAGGVEWGAMALFAVAGLVASWLVFEGFRHVDASLGALIGLSEIIWGIIFGIVFFGEELTAFMIIGGVIILAAGGLVDGVALLRHHRRKFVKEKFPTHV